uniref:Uncharacterized protein n=1 Tax=Bracon brevicornis TaxID=1563983 RepID=A0A6V7IM03_9HYME
MWEGEGLPKDCLCDLSQRGGARPGRLLDVEGDPLGVTGPLLPRENQEYRSPSEDSGLGADMPRTRCSTLILASHNNAKSFLDMKDRGEIL